MGQNIKISKCPLLVLLTYLARVVLKNVIHISLLATDINGRISVHHKQGAMIYHFQFDKNLQEIGRFNIKDILKINLNILT